MNYIQLTTGASISSFNCSDCIYEIFVNIDLNGGILDVPQNSVLRFSGGKLSNGTIRGNNTSIEAGPYNIFHNISFNNSDTWLVPQAYVEWFSTSNNNRDDNNSISKALNSCFKTIIFQSKTYNVTHSLTLNSSKNIIGAGNDAETGTIINYADTNPISVLFHIQAENVTIKGIRFQGNIATPSMVGCIVKAAKQPQNTGNPQRNENIFVHGLTMEDVTAQYCNEAAFDLQIYSSTLTRLYALNCKIGFYIHGYIDEIYESNCILGTSVTMQQCCAVATDENGYKFRYLIYSTLINCFGDAMGTGTYFPNSNKNAAYYMDHCEAITLNSCACEMSRRVMYLEWCRACNILSFYDWANDSSLLSDNKRIFIYRSKGVTFMHGIIYTVHNSAQKNIYVIDGESITLWHIATRISSGIATDEFVGSHDVNNTNSSIHFVKCD